MLLTKPLPGGSRALPHFLRDARTPAQQQQQQQQPGAEQQQQLPLEREARQIASNLAVERIARAILGTLLVQMYKY